MEFVWLDDMVCVWWWNIMYVCSFSLLDNDMINGTKLLNVAGMSRGKRDGILKNEKGRVVVKVGAMHLKGVWWVTKQALGYGYIDIDWQEIHPFF